MYLNYAKIKSGSMKQPMLRLRTLAGKELGVVSFANNLHFTINYADLSQIEFTVPYQVDGTLNPMYTALTSYKVVYTDELGIYVLTAPSKSGDGVKEDKTIVGYSLEVLFQKRNLFLEEGTYNFWNPADNADTILGRILELDPTWHVGYVASRLIGCYRTFDEYDSDALSFCYNDATEKYRCVFVFDVYEKSINVYDANEDTGTLPIYLSYKNLVDTVGVDEIVDDLATKLHLYGSDNLTIRDVNPTGTDYIVNLDYFLNNGDLDVKVGNSNLTLADRVRNWQTSITAKQTYYTGLVAARASLTAQKLAAQADLTELQGEMDTLTSQQSVIIQALALESTSTGKSTQQEKLNEINTKISAKQSEIDTQKAEVDAYDTEINEYADRIKAITNELAFSSYFTNEEQDVLNLYLIEGDIEDETFVATDVDTSISAAVSEITGTVELKESDISKVEIADLGKTMYVVAGGTLNISEVSVVAQIIRGTLEVKGDNSYVFTGYLGDTSYGEHSFSSGLITIAGSLSQFTSDISVHSENEVTEYKGTRFSFKTTSANTYFTVNVSDYQKYSVAMELYDFGVDAIDDYAWPIYEFSVESGNFLYHEKFEPFKNKLELGKSVHLELGSSGRIKARLIGIEVDFEDISSFSLVFSNQYRLKNGVESIIDNFASSAKTNRSFDASKYIYNRAADKTTEVDEFMKGQLNAAVNNIVNAADQTVLINGSGIHVGGNSNYQMRIVDNMIAMTDDAWKTAKLAIGLFSSEATGTQWGVNAEVIAGPLIIGNNLILQNPTDDGTMMFQVDATGAWLYNSRFVLQDGNTGGVVIVDPKYGIVAGNKLLFNTNGTTVSPEFMDDAGDISFDSDGMPTNANFYLDVKTGDAYLRGKLVAKSGKIGGFSIEENYLHTGSGNSYVALNGSQSNENSLYAIWAGATSPSNAPFWVKKDGSIHARSGDFSGTLSAAKISGSLTADTENGGGELIGCAIYVPSKTTPKFSVDSSGNVTMTGNIKWGKENSPVQALYARNYLSTPVYAFSNYPSSSSTDWHKTLNVAYDYYVSYSYDGGDTWTSAILLQGKNGQDGEPGRDGDDADVTRGNIARALYENSSDYYDDGIYSYRSGGRYYLAINASYILAGEIDADEIQLTCSYGGFCKGRGYTGQNTTYGSMMYGSNGKGSEPYFIVTNTGCRMSAENGIDFFVTANGVWSAEEITITSDRRLKKSIEYDMEKYEKFFMMLKPTQFRYKRGTSGRFHTGFIAQDVEDALDFSGLSTKDFAGLTITPVEEVNEKDGITDERYNLRYGEFISLNTHMIQKLVREVEDLREQIQKLKQ